MYKKVFLCLLGLAVLFAGCQKKVEDVFDKTPDERLAEALSAYQKTLSGAPYGWKMVIVPKGLETQNIKVGGLAFYMRFNDSNRVTMISDFDTTMASVFKESGFRLKAVQRPSIYFDTYSYLHIPADPTSLISLSPAGDDGYGWGTDFDFSFADMGPSDTIRLRGNFNRSEAVLIKATQQEAAAYNSGGLAASIKLLQNLNAIGYFKRLTLGGAMFYVTVDESNRLITFSWLANNTVQSFVTGYYSTLTGIGLTEPFQQGNLIVRAIDFTSWNATAAVMNVTVNNISGTISDAIQPLMIDVEAPVRWWQYAYDRELPWVSSLGFTVNGVRDAYKVQSIPGFYFIGYWAWYGTFGSTNADLLTFYKINAAGTTLFIPYAAVFTMPPTFTSDGRIIFNSQTSVGNQGTLGTVPAAEQAAYNNTKNQMADPNGYYLIQTGPLQYDMVSKDGKTWITWQWPQ